MSTTPQQSHDCERLLDAAAYVLGALSDAEAQAFQEHLAGCLECREEVSQLRDVTDSLAVGVPRVEAPAELGTQIFAAISPHGADLSEPSDQPGSTASRRGALSRRRRLIPALVAAASLGVGLLVGALAINTPAGDRSEVIRAVVVTPGHRASADLHDVNGHVQLVVEGLPAPPPGRIYEIWLERGAQEPEPTDVLFSVTSTGHGTAAVPGGLQGISHVLVTDEPLGGSLKPTRQPIIVAKI